MAKNDALPPFESESPVGLPSGHPWGATRLPNGEPDPCLGRALNQYAELLGRIASTYGNVRVNEPFDDENWGRNISPSLTPNGVYTAGEAVFPNGRTERYDVPLLDQGHVAFPDNEDGLRMLRSVLQRVQADVDPRDLEITVCDGHLGSLTADFAHRGDELYRQVHIKDRAKLLAEMEDTARQINTDVLRDWPSLREQAAHDPEVMQAGHRLTPWRVVALLGDGNALSSAETADLLRLMREGPSCGIHLLTWNIPLPEDAQNVTKVGAEVHVRPTVAPDPLAVAALSQEIAAIRNRPLASPDYYTFRELSAEGIWNADSTKGLRTVIALDENGATVEINFDDDNPHWYVGGHTGSGKSTLIMEALCLLAEKYSPDELEMYFMDFKGDSEQAAVLAGNARDPSYIPHCKFLAFGEGLDHEYSLAVLRQIEGEISRRSNLFRKAGTTSYVDYREETGDKLPRLVCFFDEIQKLIQGPLGGEVVKSLENLARTARSYGIHLLLGTQKMPSGVNLPEDASLSGMLSQFPGRAALARSEGVLDIDNNGVAGLPNHHVVVNRLGGARGSNELPARFANTDRKTITEAKRRLMERMNEHGEVLSPPRIFSGAAKPTIEDDPTYQSLQPSEMRPPRALLGKSIDTKDEGVAVTFGEETGRNLLAFGRQPEGVCDALDASVLSLSKQHKRGTPTEATFRIVGASNNPDVQARVDALVNKLAEEGQNVQAYGRRRADEAVTAVSEAVAQGRPTKEYLVIYGGENLGGAADALKLREVMMQGPQMGVHTLMASSSPDDLARALNTPSDFSPVSVKSLSDAWVVAASTNADLEKLSDGIAPPKWGGGQPRRLLYYDRAQDHKLGSKPAKIRAYQTYEEDDE